MARGDQYIHRAAGADTTQAKAVQQHLAAWRASASRAATAQVHQQQPAPSQLPYPSATAAACALNSWAMRRAGWVLSTTGLPQLRHPLQTRCLWCGRRGASWEPLLLWPLCRLHRGGGACTPAAVEPPHTREVSRPNTLVRAQSLATRICE